MFGNSLSDIFLNLSDYIIITIPIIIIVILFVYILYRIFRNPFEYPYFIYKFDVTSKRNIKFENYIDNFLISEKNWQIIQKHQFCILKWKDNTEKYIQTCLMKKYRMRQYKKILDDWNAYHFQFIRKQTRYRQRNYIKTSYKVNVITNELATNWNYIQQRYEKLKKIGFETTLNEFNSKNQRKLMTPQLRKNIMERDNYTCQMCGKYMPDEVGLHIDHIIPIAKGGKSIPSNLRVLCSKCNGKKGSK